jgi:excisionase family DNA binding protein
MIILQGITEQELFNKLEILIEKKLKEIVIQDTKEEYKYLTRKDVSKLLHITLPTLHEWTKEGLIQSYRIGNRVLYRSNEIEESVTLRKFKRYPHY